jgi:homospermidine synthase
MPTLRLQWVKDTPSNLVLDPFSSTNRTPQKKETKILKEVSRWDAEGFTKEGTQKAWGRKQKEIWRKKEAKSPKVLEKQGGRRKRGTRIRRHEVVRGLTEG